MLGVLGRGRRLDQRSAKAFGHSHAFALDVSSGGFPERQGRRIIFKINTDLSQNDIGIGFNQFQRFVVEDAIVRNLALDKGN